jgi:ATP/maltotriose-dependent transcriptional regulator MalT
MVGAALLWSSVDEDAECLPSERLAMTPDVATPTLVDDELRVLPYLSTQMSFDQIGDELVLPRATVRAAAIAIYRKLGVATRAGAVVAAARLDLPRP